MKNKYYVVICTWYIDEYDNGTVEVIKVFTEKDKADTYCDNKNKQPKKYNNIKEKYTVIEESEEDE
jgi:hypothetical protein